MNGHRSVERATIPERDEPFVHTDFPTRGGGPNHAPQKERPVWEITLGTALVIAFVGLTYCAMGVR